ncbi:MULTISPECIES: DUF2953 domain-containing protein [unclassified Clostridium]|uniref:DUF2953 domain-containing protein n=1 Tax=unclassified Clostridium TaxID=2614128 RepID=UPI001107271E|nr:MULTISPECIES: DUF2953 domain-containing protein [unclassified Clostridium]
MIHILLLILRIIGIVLLAVLGLLLAILLAVLFIPVRYKAEGSYHGQLLLSVQAAWFFHILAFRAVYEGSGLVCSLRVLGFRLWHNRDKDAAQDLEDGLETILGDEEQSLYEELQQDEEHYRKVREEHGKTGTDSLSGAGQPGGEQPRDGLAGEADAGRTENRTGEEEPGPDKKGPGIPGKIKGLAGRIRQAIRGILEKLKFSFANICDKLKGIREFTQEKKMWLEDEKNQASLRLLYRQTKRLLVHLWPGKGRCSVTFGFDDPYTTGQVLQAASLIYPFYHKQLFLYPVFDEKILDAEGSLKGRIRLSVILWLVLQVLFDGHTRRMLKGFLK